MLNTVTRAAIATGVTFATIAVARSVLKKPTDAGSAANAQNPAPSKANKKFDKFQKEFKAATDDAGLR